MFKVVWDKENNGVRLTMAPPSGEALNVCPRPVFWEELDFLGLDRLGWTYPHCKEPLLWACDRRYFYKGEIVLETSGGDLYESHNFIFISDNYLSLEPVNMDALKRINEDSIFLIEHEAMEFINGEYRKYKAAEKAKKVNPDVDFQQLAQQLSKKTKTEYAVVKESCDSFDVMPLNQIEQQGKSVLLKSKIDIFVCSFSGGKDSQVILDLVTRVIPSEDLVVIYSDTGYELPPSLNLFNEVREFYQQKYPGLKFYTSKNHQPLMYYWDKMGAPSRVLRWCCSIMKSAPLARLLKEITGGDKQPSAILFDGVRAEESARRANRSRIGKNVKHHNIINVRPILNWNTTEVYLYILLHDLPFNLAYRLGFSRVGCVICPYSSNWSENIVSKTYPASLQPFIDAIRKSLERSNVQGIDNYIKLGKWKERAGGKIVDCESSLVFNENGETFKCSIANSRESIEEWLKVLGPIQYISKSLSYSKGIVNYKGRPRTFSVTRIGETTLFEVSNTNSDVVLISRLKRICYKSTYCIHCEDCEVECPIGALSVVENVSVDSNKCVHCFNCLEFTDKGCMCAKAVDISENKTSKNMKSATSGIDRYRDGMGLREAWLKKYFATYETFFDNDSHGLNPRYQIPPFTNWIREAGILNSSDKTISEVGKIMASVFSENPQSVWELIFINLTENSEIAKWFFTSVPYDRSYTKQELEIMIQDSFPDLKDRTLKNPLNSLLNTFKESPLGSFVPVAVPTTINRKPGITRKPHNELSLVGAAYSLYRYAEKVGRRSLTVSEFYNPEQTDGIVRQFGIERESLEQILRSLEQDSNHVLRAELKMGLDNIILRDDLTSEDIIKLMLK